MQREKITNNNYRKYNLKKHMDISRYRETRMHVKKRIPIKSLFD